MKNEKNLNKSESNEDDMVRVLVWVDGYYKTDEYGKRIWVRGHWKWVERDKLIRMPRLRRW